MPPILYYSFSHDLAWKRVLQEEQETSLGKEYLPTHSKNMTNNLIKQRSITLFQGQWKSTSDSAASNGMQQILDSWNHYSIGNTKKLNDIHLKLLQEKKVTLSWLLPVNESLSLIPG